MMNLKKEYNEFGPWLSEIFSEEDITHQFVHLKKEILEADLSVKVPVDKEWRNVKEGELLYEAIMSLDKIGISYHRIIEGVAYSCKVKFSDITFISLVKDLLSYNLEVGTDLENLHIQYIPIPPKLAERYTKLLIDGFVECNSVDSIHKLIKGKLSLYYKEGIAINGELLSQEMPKEELKMAR